MKSSLPVCFLLALLVLATGCESLDSSSSTTVWRRPQYFGGPKKSVGVAVLAYRKETRVRMEDALVAALRARGVAAKASYPLIDTQTMVSNKAAAVATAKSMGVEAVLAVRLVDLQTLKNARIAPSNSGEALAPWQNWYEFFTVKSAFATDPAAVRPGQTVGVQATFYESPSGSLLWSATFTEKVLGSESQPGMIAADLVKKLEAAALVP